MNSKTFKRLYLLTAIMLLALSFSGCARYAKNVSPFYEPISMSRSGSGNIHIVTPADQQTTSENMKWVIGTVNDDDGKKIDEVLSSVSPTELIKDALAQELKRSGYSVSSVYNRTEDQKKSLVISRVDMKLDQTSDIADLKASCKLTVSIDVYKNGQIVKKLQYESSNSDTNIKDRNLLANKVLQEALQSVMKKAIPDLITILEH